MNFRDIEKIINKAYFPTTEVSRHVSLPLKSNYRNENDSEHSFSLALIGSALAEKIGLDAGKVALYALYHDLLEIYSGDTSVWDEKGNKTKTERESAAILRIKKEFKSFPIFSHIIDKYESFFDQEACFVYALDKLLPLVINIQANGKFYHQNKITFKMHMKKVDEVRPKVSKHHTVLEWYDQAVQYTIENSNKLFYK